jgi:hypothetical protein
MKEFSSDCVHAAGFTVTEPNALPRPAAATYIDHVEKVILRYLKTHMFRFLFKLQWIVKYIKLMTQCGKWPCHLCLK